MVDGSATVVVEERFLDFPVILLGADGEFEVFAGDGVPVLFFNVSERKIWRRREGTHLVDHHDGEEVADCSEEEAVEVVLDGVADGVAENIQDNLTDDEKERSKSNIT